MKRALFCGDLHSLHRVGLCHPFFQEMFQTADKFAAIRAECWNWFQKEVRNLGTIDVAVWNGDLIDGKAKRCGGRDVLTGSIRDQLDNAFRVISFVGAKKNIIIYGTPYHVGDEDDWEELLTHRLQNVDIGGHEFIDIEGTIFDVRHKIGSSSIPHGRYTQIAKEKLWNQLWSLRDQQPDADVIIRSHVHYFAYCGQADWLAMTLPALQAAGSIYGGRQCSGTVDYGFVHFDCYEGRKPEWQPHILNVLSQKVQPLKV